MVPLQVRMKHVKQKIPPKDTQSMKESESDSADEKVRKWLSDGENFREAKDKNRNTQNKTKSAISKDDPSTTKELPCGENTNKVERKGGKKRLAANFGPK